MITATVVPSERLTLIPVSASHAGGALFNILSDHTLCAFTGSEPPRTIDTITYWFSLLGASSPPRGVSSGLTWIVHLKHHTPTSYVQATITEAQGAVSWLTGTAWQGQGYASEAITVLVSWLVGHHINGGSCLWVELGCKFQRGNDRSEGKFRVCYRQGLLPPTDVGKLALRAAHTGSLSYFEPLGASNRRQQKPSREFGIPQGSGHPPDIGANDHFKQSIVARERHIKSLILKHKQYSR